MAISSSSSSPFKYDAYLSFRSHDTRHGFTSHLEDALRYRKINAFFNEDPKEGVEITPSAFVNPIQHSKVAIIVLSMNYAYSSFRLEELSYILDNFQGKVIPVFYNVGPAHLINLEGTYGHAFDLHEQKFRYEKRKVQKWRNALNQIANFPGFHLVEGGQYEYKFIEKIVNQVFLHTTVGLKSPLKEVRSLLELDSGAEVHTVGIYGAAEIGKTTLARVVYGTISDQFEASYFISDMGKNSKSNIHGLKHLQNILLSELVGMNNIDIRSAQEGSLLIQKRLQGKKVLLVLDGVDEIEHLEDLVKVTGWLGSGSRLIITTRNQSLLGFYRIVRAREVKPLHDMDALELLRQHILKDGNADQSNKETLAELVTYAAGLPLALKVIGSYLFGKSVDEWKNALRQFKRVPPKDIQRKVFDILQLQLQTSTPMDPHSSQGGAEQGNPPNDHPKGSDWETWFWRGVGTLSGVVGPLFFALSPPSKCVSEEWKVLLIACSMWILVIWVFLHCAKPNLFPKQHRRYTGYMVFLIITIYSFYYDKAIDNKPSIYSVVSNAAFALVSLSKSKLDDLGFETGTFCYFLACCTIQLMGFESKFYLFGILLTCPLYLWHFPSKPQDQTLPQYSKNTTRPKSGTKLQYLGKKTE